ncbi:hypothetical protein SAMN05216174_12133 [Actinokineospora iranica]|uniref:Uncharacterized protein n=2 Tax=Actinokineospora iranica TaxID=1271860 RepID=A0A1G6YFQ9_9PSEU|nr:hypothetical protein SAMN05216174_12133 [Actinokineospora iranica]
MMKQTLGHVLSDGFAAPLGAVASFGITAMGAAACSGTASAGTAVSRGTGLRPFAGGRAVDVIRVQRERRAIVGATARTAAAAPKTGVVVTSPAMAIAVKPVASTVPAAAWTHVRTLDVSTRLSAYSGWRT